MTPAGLILARDGDAGATADATTLWQSIIGHGDIGDVDYVKRRVQPSQAGTALDAVAQCVGSGTDVPDHTLAESIFRCGWYLVQSAAVLGFHGSIGESLPDGDPARSGFSALRRSGAMALLEPWKSHRAGLV